jgi:hypothetical protein
MFIATKGVARVSCYLALAEQADEQILYYIDERLENDCVESLFLTTLQSQIRAREKKRRNEMENKERELFCSSLRQVEF